MSEPRDAAAPVSTALDGTALDSTARRALLQRAYGAIDAQQTRIRELEARLAREPLAIVGLSCRFPGASDPEAYWELLRSGTDAIGDVPPDRWDVDAFYDANPDAPGRMYTRQGGFLRDVAGFDAAFFGISPREAAAMDPQHRLLLETTWDALDRAGQPRDRLAGSQTGVFIGITANEYGQVPPTPDGLSGIDAYHITGNTLNAAAGRIAYTLGFRGPAIAVDTACSSSLVAVHLACAAIWNGDCDQAVAGGVHLILSPAGHVALSKARVLSPGGRCRTFDASADGMARGEGCGVIVLRRLSDAVRDGDPIVAVIRGSAVNQDGPSSGLTVPNGPAQEDVIRRALAHARTEPREVDYVEAHGTATPLGDPIEITAIGAALCAERSADAPLLVGSVKTNLGHMEAAAGIAGLIKVALALQHGEIPRHLHFSTPTPKIPWAALPIAVVTSNHAWPAGPRARVAGVSAFGFSGTNAHVVLAEAPAPASAGDDPVEGVHVMRVAARSRAAFAELAGRYARHVAAHPEQRLADICSTANTGRGDGVERGVVIARTRAEMVEGLDRLADGGHQPGVTAGRAPERPRVGFVFDTQPVQPGIGRECYDRDAAFRDAVDRVAAAAAPALGGDVRDVLYGSAGERLGAPAYARVAQFAVAAGLTAVWRAWGVAPWGTTGTRTGEWAAAVAAGALDLERAARLVAEAAPSLTTALAGAGLQAQARFERPDGDHSLDDATARLRAHGCEVLLRVGLNGAPGERVEVLTQLAELYVAGVRIDWAALDRRPERRRVVLPAYPWQRERFWNDRPATSDAPGATRIAADAATSGAAQTEAGSDDPCAGWSYEIAWRPIAATVDAGATLPAGRALERLLEPHLADVRADAATTAYAGALDDLERRALAFAADALERLGLGADAGPATATALASRLGIAASRLPLFVRVLGMLGDAGAFAHDGETWRRVPANWPAGPDSALDALVARHPSAEAEFRILERCGGALPDVLRGSADPLALLFPPDGSFTAAHLYGDSPAAHAMNGIVGQVFQAIASASRDAGSAGPTAPLRILELGAGTGGTTAAVLPALASLPRTPEYSFTDVSPAFLAQAAARFSEASPFLRTARLDIEAPPAAQGFSEGACDVVLAANILHATADLGRSLDHAAQLLTPDGLLILQEWTGAMRAIDLIFGLTDGWWRFTDRHVRADHPLLSTDRWRALLEAHGFEDVAVLGSAPGDRGGLEKQAVIVARRKRAAGRWLVVGHDAPSAERVCAALTARGCDAAVSRADDLSQAHAIAGVVDLRALDAPSADALQGADMQAAAERLGSGLLGLVQSLARNGTAACQLVVVTRGAVGGGAIEHSAVAMAGERVDGLVQSPLWGLGKVVALEHPNLRTMLVDIDRATDTATAVADAIDRGRAETQLVVREGRFSVPRLQPLRGSHAGRAIRFAGDAAYIVTGGFGGLGLLLADWLATKGAGCVVLVGRHAPSSDAAGTIQAIEARGTRVVARQADVADVDRISAVLTDVRGTGFRIAGVFHAAGILDDGILLQLDEERLARALAPKVQGTWNLHVATAADRLEHFVLFSAATSLFGSAGQASHAAANAFLDSFAAYRRATGQPALSINWGAWEQVGKAAGTDVARRVRMKGLRGIEPARGLALLERLLQASPAQVGVFSVDWPAIPAAMKTLPFLAECVAAPAATSANTPAPSSAVSFVAEFAAAPAQRKRPLLAEQVRTDIRRVLALNETAAIDMKQGLFELGVDSLTSMELRDRLQVTCGCPLPSTLVFDYPTPDAIVSHILALMGGAAASTPATPPAAPASTPAADHAGRVDADRVPFDGVGPESAADQLQRKLAELRQALGS